MCFNSSAQRKDILLNNNWNVEITDKTATAISANETIWNNVNIPHNADAYDGYRRLLHGNKHGAMAYSKKIQINKIKTGKRYFLFFEGVGSYATVFVNGKFAGEHAGGRTTFTLDITELIKSGNSLNEIFVNVSHPANINDLPWVCGGCSDERGFSEGSQPMGIFRPVHLIVTNDIRITPFGIHAWAEMANGNAKLFIDATVKNYAAKRNISIIHQLVDAKGKIVKEIFDDHSIKENDSITFSQKNISILNPILWSVENPYLYKIISIINENNIVIDKVETAFGFRSINFKTASHQFLLNNKPVFINGIAEYEHLLGQSHAFSHEQIVARIKWIQAAGFNALRDAHQPHNLLYGKLCNEEGLLWWTQFSAHVWYDTKAFRDNFKTLMREWVIERRNDPSVILWGLQNESKLPKDFAEECTAIIRSLDPTAFTQRLITTCNGGEGADWDVPQNWTGTYGGDPKTYAADLKKQILVGEYGAWRTLDLHSDADSLQKGMYTEEKMTALLETKIRLAESVKDSVAGHFAWLLTSHDNPGRVQGGEGLREMDRIGPVNYKGLLTPWEEPTDAFYMYRSNYASKEKSPMVYIASHTWPNRWMSAGIKSGINIYSYCDEVELFNDVDNISLGRKVRNGIGTHFQWDNVDIQYNVLYAVGYVNNKIVARDTVVLFHLPASPNFKKLYSSTTDAIKPLEGYEYKYRINCGGADYTDVYGNKWLEDRSYDKEITGHGSTTWANDYTEIPPFIASQRRTFSPIKNTKDWKLFQSFRYGKDRLKFLFDLEDGDYIVELFFIEPWLGIGGGKNARAMRLFNVSINDKTVLKNVDIWKEVGSNCALKKTINVSITGGKMVIAFPETKIGQAVISAIAIASKNKKKNIASVIPSVGGGGASWLDIGDKIFKTENIQINSLPSNLFGANWFQLGSHYETKKLNYLSTHTEDYFFCVKEGAQENNLFKSFENTHTNLVTDENGGTTYNVYRKRFAPSDSINVNLNSNIFLCKQPVSNMQPAYDLKPIVSYRPATAKMIGDGFEKRVINEKETILFTKNETAIEWNVNIGAADIYSLTIRYANETGKGLLGKLEFVAANGTIMKTEKIIFTNSKLGKWNYITTNTGSMVNAGNYIVRIVADDARGVGISALDIQ